jgi:hypothetical protein
MSLHSLKGRLQKLEASAPKPPNPFENATDAERVLAILELILKASRREGRMDIYERFEPRWLEVRDYVTVGKFDQRFEEGVRRDLEFFRQERYRQRCGT